MFTPNLSILPEPQRRLWVELRDTPKTFVLYGGTALALRALSGEVDLPLPPPVLNWTALDTLFTSLAHDELARPKVWERAGPLQNRQW